jgi:hypothetical protein
MQSSNGGHKMYGFTLAFLASGGSPTSASIAWLT